MKLRFFDKIGGTTQCEAITHKTPYARGMQEAKAGKTKRADE